MNRYVLAMCLNLFLLTAIVWARQPNIILVLTDDQGVVSTSPDSFGGTYATPHLDQLANEGLTFASAYASPKCSVSRATILSGKYAHEHGVVDNRYLSRYRPTHGVPLGKALQKAGYTTAMVGKWHLWKLETTADARAWGWNNFVTVDHRDSRYWRPAVNQDGVQVPTKATDYGPDMMHQYAINFIKANRNRPFYLHYAMFQPHAPYLSTPDKRSVAAGSHEAYVANLAYADKLLGDLRAQIHQLGLDPFTVIIFAGDNGSTRRAKQLLDGKRIDGWKGTLREGGSLVPFVAYWAGHTPANRTVEALIDFADLYPTFLELAGQPGARLSGESFVDVLLGNSTHGKDSVYVHLGNQGYTRWRDEKIYTNGTRCDMRQAPYKEVCQ